jgi:hypothetical protein
MVERRLDIVDKAWKEELKKEQEITNQWTQSHVNLMADHTEQIESLKKKLEWAEMKLNNLPRKVDYPAFPTKLHLTIDPIETKNKNYNRAITLPVQVIDKRIDKKMSDSAVKKKVINNIKTKLNELSQ